MSFDTETGNALKAELLCIADSNWILGHWYINCMLNGRELTDFTSMAGIAEDKLGHTRALFRFMEEYFELPEFQLEFGRNADAVHNMALLDAPPQNWADFILGLYLADVAIWRLCDSLRECDFAPVANMLRKFGEESYFHQLCIDGWLKALDDEEMQQLLEALPARLAQALAWFEGADTDLLLDAGMRSTSGDELKARYLQQVSSKIAQLSGQPAQQIVDQAGTVTVSTGDWDSRRRRTAGSTMPARLWESVVPTSEAAQLARRPLAVSVDDNIDLFTTAKRDETEPQWADQR